MHFVEVGEGTPMLALHGYRPDHRLMLGALEPIFARAPGYRRIYPDLPGMGKTPAPASIAGSDDMLAALLAFVDEVIGDEPFLLAGESYGGYLARGVVKARPGQVLGLALICSIGAYSRPSERTLPPRMVLRVEPGVLEGVDVRTAEQFSSLAVVLTAETLRRFREEIAPGLDAADDEALVRLARRYGFGESPESGEPFTRPALIVAGRQDHVVGYADQYALLDHYPRATYAVLDVAGHNLQIEQPVLFGALVREWLERVRVSRTE